MFLSVPLRDPRALGRARLDLSVWARSFATWWAPHLYPFREYPDHDGAEIRARMFAPEMGIAEDPATGAAAAALAGYLTDIQPPGKGTLRWAVDQGIEMGGPSRLYLECDRAGAGMTAVRVGGASVMVAEARFTHQLCAAVP